MGPTREFTGSEPRCHRRRSHAGPRDADRSRRRGGRADRWPFPRRNDAQARAVFPTQWGDRLGQEDAVADLFFRGRVRGGPSVGRASGSASASTGRPLAISTLGRASSSRSTSTGHSISLRQRLHVCPIAVVSRPWDQQSPVGASPTAESPRRHGAGRGRLRSRAGPRRDGEVSGRSAGSPSSPDTLKDQGLSRRPVVPCPIHRIRRGLPGRPSSFSITAADAAAAAGSGLRAPVVQHSRPRLIVLSVRITSVSAPPGPRRVVVGAALGRRSASI